MLLVQLRLTRLGYLGDGATDGIFGDETWHAVVAFQGWQRMARDGLVGPITLRALATAQRPRPWIRMNHALEIDLTRQVLLVVRDGTTQRVLHASTAAPPFATPVGRFAIIRRERKSWSRPYHVWLPDALYFTAVGRSTASHAYQISPKATAASVSRCQTHAPFFAEASLGTPVIIRGHPTTPPPIPPIAAAGPPRHLATRQRTRR